MSVRRRALDVACLLALMLLGSLIAVPPFNGPQAAEAAPADCNSYYTYRNTTSQVPEAPGASAAGAYDKTCGYKMTYCSGGTWTKGQWHVAQATGGAFHFITASGCFSRSWSAYYNNTRAQCADYTGGNNYANCIQRNQGLIP